ncbi:hypothetical protein [Actinoplanes subglobosus]|uniref:Nephrocystin 3-like N-terminal domain-containing protein n=1 Tax=Actinoplanes subglobosus TaxID=1547892 RepID=A0ABV8IHG7_9ACTN
MDEHDDGQGELLGGVSRLDGVRSNGDRMDTQRTRRLVLVIGSQCAVLGKDRELSFLPSRAAQLRDVLMAPELGACLPAVGDGLLCDPTVSEVRAAVSAAFRAADDGDGATLLLAFLGHGLAIDDDFYYFPRDAAAEGSQQQDLHLSQTLKEHLRDHPGVEGLLVLLDTCDAGAAAGQVAAWKQVGLGRHKRRIEMLTSSATRPAYGGRATAAMIETLCRGVPSAGQMIGSADLHAALKEAAPDQQPQFVSVDGGSFTREAGLWWARNVIWQAPRPTVRVTYVDQVRLIAPEDLFDREAELTELADFCTADDRGPYVWWRAPAWAGKSALMSTFVLNPPDGVQIVSFFITARYAGQDNRAAFTELVVTQLAELMSEPVPTMSEATQDLYFRAVLTRAAEHVRAQGRRLVLLVDGLDEDRGVTSDGRGHSIAAVLPERLPPDVRVIVSSRPNPPIPQDVPEGHPLRNDGIVRELTHSDHADAAQNEMMRELDRLLSADSALLGLITAAGGGLSVRDLIELGGGNSWDIESRLHTVAGRSFDTRLSHWQPDIGPEVYVLGHEQIQRLAVERLGEKELARHRERLHLWADDYRRKAWPETTPEYLLRGYFQLLRATGDRARMLALATDVRRHDRMLDLSGGDSTALFEIATTQDAFAAADVPDLVAIARLAVHCSALTGRNAHIPATLPALWTRLGRPERSDALVRGIADPHAQTCALMELARVSTGDRRVAAAIQATSTIRAIDNPKVRVDLYPDLVETLGLVGEADRARTLLADTANPEARQQALVRLAHALSTSGERDRAASFVAAITDPEVRAAVSVAITADLPADLVHAATALTRGTANMEGRGMVQARFAAALPGRKAARFAGEALAVADGLAPHGRIGILTALIPVLSALGDSRAPMVIRRALDDSKAIDSYGNHYRRTWALADLAHALVAAGQPGKAAQVAATAFDAARGIPVAQRVPALVAAAGALDAAGHHRRAEDAREQAREAAEDIRQGQPRARALKSVVDALINAGDLSRAETLAGDIPDRVMKIHAETALARAKAAAGDHHGTAVTIRRTTGTIEELPDPRTRANLLAALARAVFAAGRPTDARDLATRAEAAAHAVGALESQNVNRALLAAELASDTERTAALDTPSLVWRRSAGPVVQDDEEVSRARTLARTGRFDSAVEAARSVRQSGKRDRALAAVAAALPAERRELATTLIHEIEDRDVQEQTLTLLVIEAATASDYAGARTLSTTAEDPAVRGRVLSSLATVVADARRLDEAVDIAGRIPGERDRGIVLGDLARRLAAERRHDRALSVATGIKDVVTRAEALTALVRPLIPVDRDWAVDVCTQALAEAHRITAETNRGRVLAELARLMLALDEHARALATARVVPTPALRRRLLTEVVEAQVTVAHFAPVASYVLRTIAAEAIEDREHSLGALASVLLESYDAVAEHTLSRSGSIREPTERVLYLAGLIRVLAAAGDHSRIADAGTRAIDAASLIADDTTPPATGGRRRDRLGNLVDLSRDRARGELAEALAVAGDRNRALKVSGAIVSAARRATTLAAVMLALGADLTDAVRTAAEAVQSPKERAYALVGLVKALAARGDIPQASSVTQEIVHLSLPVGDRSKVLLDLARTWAFAGDTARALQTTAAVADSADRDRNLAELARALNADGRRDEAIRVVREIESRDMRARISAVYIRAMASGASEFAFEAIAAAGDISDTARQAAVSRTLADALLDAGLREEAATVADAIRQPELRAELLIDLVQDATRAHGAAAATPIVAAAEQAARAVYDPKRRADLLTTLAGHVEPATAARLVAAALQTGQWQTCIGQLRRLDPEAIGGLADEFLRTARNAS